MGRFLYKAMSGPYWGEHEIDHVILIRDFDLSDVHPNPEEVEEIVTVLPSGLDKMTKGEFCMRFELRKFSQLHVIGDMRIVRSCDV